MKLIRECESNIPFSLHDSRIIKIEMVDDSLRFYLDRVFEYKNNAENYYPACMCFRDIAT